jgi:hypothetical protein
MPDLAGHDQRPSAFLVYLALWRLSSDSPDSTKGIHVSLQHLAALTGLSRSTVQHSLSHLSRRQLISTRRASPTAIPRHTVLRPWGGGGNRRRG